MSSCVTAQHASPDALANSGAAERLGTARIREGDGPFPSTLPILHPVPAAIRDVLLALRQIYPDPILPFFYLPWGCVSWCGRNCLR